MDVYDLIAYVVTLVLGFLLGHISGSKRALKIAKEAAELVYVAVQALSDYKVTAEEVKKVEKEFTDFKKVLSENK